MGWKETKIVRIAKAPELWGHCEDCYGKGTQPQGYAPTSLPQACETCKGSGIRRTHIELSEGGYQDAWRCVCNNTLSDYGFFPSDERGIEEDEPDDNWDGIHYTCDKCGRTIDGNTGEIKGMRTMAKVATDDKALVRYQHCNGCDGTGKYKIPTFDTCPGCNGSGMLPICTECDQRAIRHKGFWLHLNASDSKTCGALEDAMIRKRAKTGVTKRDLNIPTSPHLDAVLGKLHQKGHKALVVGGAVRDALLGEKPKDVDVEVYGTSYDELADTLKPHGKVNLVGKAFGVVKFTDRDRNEYDFSLPRKDNKTGVGHKDFKSEFDPDITPKEAASRRDFTFNSLAYDPINKELHDYHGGEQDLKDKVIRHTSDQFAEDPLRVLRGMQFSARYGMTVHPDTAKLAKSIKHEHSTLPKERVSEEFMKMATKGKEPGRALDYLQETGWSENFPELHVMRGTPQEPEWHPEGDLHEHTKHAMNAAAKIADREGRTGDDRAVTVFGAMLHDVGKPDKTDTSGDRITSHGHDQHGEQISRDFLDAIGVKKDISDRVAPVVREHMQHLNFQKGPSSRTVRRLADRLHPATIKELSYVMESDHSARPPLPGGLPSGAQNMLDKAADSNVTEKRQERLVNGRDVMPYFNNEPGPHIGEHVNAAYQAQLDGEINTPEEGKAWLKQRLSSKEGSWEDDFDWDDPKNPTDPELMYDIPGGACDAGCHKTRMRIGDLFPHVDRPSVDEPSKDSYKFMFTEHGWKDSESERDPIRFINQAERIDDGNHRVVAAHELGWDDLEVPVHYHGVKRLGSTKEEGWQEEWDHLHEKHNLQRTDLDLKHMQVGHHYQHREEQDHDHEGMEKIGAVFYHTSPTKNRKSIQNEGIKPSQEGHVYLTDEHDFAQDLADTWEESGAKSDVWEVQVEKGKVKPDPEWYEENEVEPEDARWHMHEGPIHPSKIRRVSRFEPGLSDYESEQMRNVRHDIYKGEDPQKLTFDKQLTCSETSSAVDSKTGWAAEFGEYWGDEVRPSEGVGSGVKMNLRKEWDKVKPTGHSHMEGYGHWWNRKSDGTIVDASSDQFKKGEGVRVIPPDDPRQKDYWTETTGVEGHGCKECSDEEYPSFSSVPWGPGHPYHDLYKHRDEKTASWKDVRNKAVRLRNANMVDFTRLDSDVIAADVTGDHHVYQVVLYRQFPDSMAITTWECSCKWGDWAFRRQVTYVGRFCSHALATLYAAHGKEYTKVAASNEANECYKCDGSGAVQTCNTCNGFEEYSNPADCPSCGGKSKEWYDEVQCPDCKGSGLLRPTDRAWEQAWSQPKAKVAKPWGWDKRPPLSSISDEEVRAMTKEHRRAEGVDSGMCWSVTEELEATHGQHMRVGGQFVHKTKDKNGKPFGVEHYWNLLPNGDILDPTADQFNHKHWREQGGKGMRVPIRIPYGHPLQDRYLPHDVHNPSLHDEVGGEFEMSTNPGKDTCDGCSTEPHNEGAAVRSYPVDHKEFYDDYAKVNEASSKRGVQWRAKNGAWVDPKLSAAKSKLTFYGANRPITISVEVSRDATSITQGLMNRQYLGPREGMVFVPPQPPSYSGMWMMNCLIPLTVMFWDREGRIMEIIDMPLCTPGRCPVYQPKKSWWGAVEVNQGFQKQWSIGVGSRVELSL